MKHRMTLFVVLLMFGCKENHQHDGIYIAERPFTGVMKAWIVEGNAITYYLMGLVTVTKCRQYADRIETADNKVYRMDADGNLIIPGNPGITKDEKLVKRSSRTDLKPAEIEKMIDEAMPPPGVLEGMPPRQR